MMLAVHFSSLNACLVARSTSSGAGQDVCSCLYKKNAVAGKLKGGVVQSLWPLCCVAGCCLAFKAVSSFNFGSQSWSQRLGTLRSSPGVGAGQPAELYLLSGG